MKKFQCLEDRVLVRPIKKTEPETTEAGLFDVSKKPTAEGVVINVGEGRYAGETGTFMPTRLAKGDKVIYGANQGMPIRIENEDGQREDVLIMRESDILLVIS